jgi:hypothetical protein
MPRKGVSTAKANEAIGDLLDEIVRLPRNRRLNPVDNYRLVCDEDEEDLDPQKVQALMRRARAGNGEAEATLRWLVHFDLSEGHALHKSLHSYVFERLERGPPKAKKGHPAWDNGRRDWLLHVAVEKLLEMGFDKTKNPASKHESACSFIKNALAARDYGIGERAIYNAWKRHIPVELKWRIYRQRPGS